MYAPASQFLNAFLVGATMAFAVLGTTPGGLMALAREKVTSEVQGGKIDARLPAATESQERPVQPQSAPTEAKAEAIVPPLVRKRPPPAPTSVPIVAPPEKPAKGAAKGTPPTSAKTKVKAAEKAVPKDVKCAAGLKYDAKLLKCAKIEPAKASASTSVRAKP